MVMRNARPAVRLAGVFVGATALGLVAALLMPRGPVTTTQALVLLALGLAFGALAGWLTGSRWAMLAAPAGYVLGFEPGWAPSNGMTVDAIRFDTTWGVLAFAVGRGFHALVAVVPMVLGTALGASAVRRRERGGQPARRSAGLVLRRALTAATAAGLVLLTVLLVRPASTPAITGADGKPLPGSIAELERVRIGGVEQWLSIRGRDRRAPVLLYLPGGPGQSDLGLSRALLEPLTHDFVVVTWDGRGIGKAYPSFDEDAATTERIVADTIEVTDHLRRRFAQRRIFLFGESGGTITGVFAAQRHPDRFHAWIGSGQMVDLTETDRLIRRDLLATLRREGDDDAAAKLESFGEPPYDSPHANAFVMQHYERIEGDYDPPAAYTRRGERSGVGFFGLGASEYALIDKVGALRGLADTFGAVYPRWAQIDLRRSVPRLELPVYIFRGEHELAGRRALADEWYAALEAPLKQLHSFPDAGHATAFEHADELRRVLVHSALPYARRH